WGYTSSPSSNSKNYVQDYWYSGGSLYNDNSYPNIYTIGYHGTSSTLATYTVAFTESGLPYGTSWSVTFNGNAKSSTTSTISYTGIANGSYSFSVESITGYVASPSSGTITVNGTNVNQTITFIENNNQFNPDEVVQVVWSVINVRAGPGLSYEIIGTENYGSQGVVDFGNIVSNNGYLWIPV
ncbi:MAG: hypothetical protein ACP5TO_08360, partial [Thermoplasmata archaeon]